MKKILLILTWILGYSLYGQEITTDLYIFGNQKSPRTNPFDDYTLGAMGQTGFAYSDTLSGHWDYKVGLAYAGSTTENYYSFVEVDRIGFNNEPQIFNRIIGDYYQSYNVALSLGANYWPWQKRKGLFIPLEFVPVFLVDSDLRENRVDSDGRLTTEHFDVDDTFARVHFHIRTGIGYKLSH